MRGSFNKKAVLNLRTAKPFVKEAFETSVIALKEQRYFSCSIDGDALPYKTFFLDTSFGVEISVRSGVEQFLLVFLETKTPEPPSAVVLSSALQLRTMLGETL